MMDQKLFIIGAGETALLAFEYFMHDSNYDVQGFAVEKEFIAKDEIFNLPIFSIEELTEKYPPEVVSLFIAVSSNKLNRERTRLYLKLKKYGYKFASYISTKAFIWHNVTVGENCFILEDNTIQPFVSIGSNVTLWSGNHIGHRTIIHDNCFISSHCVISGFCEIGKNSFLGVNCTLEDGVKVEDDCFIGAGALIRKNTDFKGLYQETPTSLSKIDTHRLFKIQEK